MAAALLMIGWPDAASAQDAPAAPDLKRGEELLTKSCGQCHAVGRTGASPRPDANVRQMLGRPGEAWAAESGTDHLVVYRFGAGAPR